VRGSHQLTSNQESGEYKGSAGSCPRVLRVSFSCFPGFSLALDPSFSTEENPGQAWEGKLAVLV